MGNQFFHGKFGKQMLIPLAWCATAIAVPRLRVANGQHIPLAREKSVDLPTVNEISMLEVTACYQATMPCSMQVRTSRRHALCTRTSRTRSGEIVMQEAPFWSNVLQFVRFFISSVSGLVLGLLSPFSFFARTPLLLAIGSTLALSVLIFLYVTLQAMQTPTLEVGTSVLAEPSMQGMLNDIYGQ